MLYEGTPEEYIEAEERRRLYYEEQQQAEYAAFVAREQAIEQEHPEIYAGVLGLLEGRVEPSVILAWLNAERARIWDEGHDAGYEDARDHHAFGFGCGPDPHDCDCPNPYRKATT